MSDFFDPHIATKAIKLEYLPVFNNTILKFSQILKSTRRNSEKCSLVCKSDFYPFLRRHFIIVILSQVAVLIASSSPLRLCFGATKGLAVGAAALLPVSVFNRKE